NTGEQRALAFILKKDAIAFFQGVAKGLGTKVHSIAPRPLGTMACWQATSTAAAEPATHAIVTLAGAWAELCVVQNGQLVQARTLNRGPGLAMELRRSITVFEGQAANRTIQDLSLFGFEPLDALVAQFRDTLRIPVQVLDPLSGVESLVDLSSRRGAFAAGIG